MSNDLGVWEPMTPRAAAELFGRLTTPWWIAGGYAIELLVGRTLRSHGDIDVLLLRRDQQTVHEVLNGWDIQAADPPGTLRPWYAGEWLPAGVHDIWCRENADGPWRIQVMLDEADGDEWRSRRDPRIHRPITSLGLLTEQGIPVLAPEVQLFYKSKRKLEKDETDFTAALPFLNSDARQWLDDSLALTAPNHPWREALPR
ncbi:nucleotidyltransferase domain-containing protein [Kribbella sp. CA-247076]|uniref:nucleotidyltransferase domain-containing protein n=1 Tax=Kribbella sp. CA-247076 TaxID=3239941 RepID=UPI003D91B8B9